MPRHVTNLRDVGVRARRFRRVVTLAAATALLALGGRDVTAQTQLKPNVLFLLDTSASMQEDPYAGSIRIGGDDPASKFYVAKRAIETFMLANRNSFNFGFATYNLLNSDKVLLGSPSAPVAYVTRNDQPGVSIWTGRLGYFSDNPGSTDYLYTGYATPAEDARVWRSFVRVNGSGFSPPVVSGPGCPDGVACRVPLLSRLYRTGLRFHWATTATGAGGQASGVGAQDILLDIARIDCSNFPPPVGLFPDDPPGLVRPCIQMQNNGAGADSRTTTFWYGGVRWHTTGDHCGGAAVLENVAPCGVDNVAQIRKRLQLELPLWDSADPSANTNTCAAPRGTACALVPAAPGTTASPIVGTNPAIAAGLDPNALGVTAGQSSPLGGALEDIFINFDATFAGAGGTPAAEQRNVIVILTDGVETCGTNAPVWAHNLWDRVGHAQGQWAETIVIRLSPYDQQALDAVACAGSGGALSNCTATTCDCAGGLRRRAHSAMSTATLIQALQSALAVGSDEQYVCPLTR